MNSFTITSQDECILYLKNRDPRLSLVIDLIGDITCHIHVDGYSFIVEEIIGQMLSNKVADVISERLYRLCNGVISPKTISSLTLQDLRGIGLSMAKSEYILCFNKAINEGDLILDDLKDLDDREVMHRLMKVRGIGSWTSKMYLLFVLRRDDVLPYEDGAFMQAFKWLYNTKKLSPEDVKKRCKRWSPYTSVGARYLYRALDSGLTKKPFREYLKN